MELRGELGTTLELVKGQKVVTAVRAFDFDQRM